MEIDTVLALGGVFVGLASGFFGIGGGTITVPLLLFLGFDIKLAIALSAMQMSIGSLFGSFLHIRASVFSPYEVLLLGLGGIIGAIIGSYSVHLAPHRLLEYLFLALLLFTLIKLFLSSAVPNRTEVHSRFLHIGIGFGIGLFSGLLGVGGAILLTPILVGYLGFPLKKAAAMSLLFVCFTTITSTCTFALLGLLPFSSGLILTLFSLIGIYGGIRLAHHTPPSYFKILLVGLYVVLFTITCNKIFL